MNKAARVALMPARRKRLPKISPGDPIDRRLMGLYLGKITTDGPYWSVIIQKWVMLVTASVGLTKKAAAEDQLHYQERHECKKTVSAAWRRARISVMRDSLLHHGVIP